MNGGSGTYIARITPACAGNISEAHTPQPAAKDHPRMRGEHFDIARDMGVKYGSPPHARGT